MKLKTRFTELLHVHYPVIMAPMFMVSNEEMMKAALRAGVMGVFPTLNFRKEGELDALLQRLNRPGRFHTHPVSDVTASSAVSPSVLQ